MIADISNFPRPDRSKFLAKIILDNNFKVFVEIGTGNGLNVWSVLYYVKDPDFRVFCVDPYTEYPGFCCEEFDINSIQERITENWSIACQTIFQNPRCIHLKQFSVDAAKRFKDETIDIIFIDGNHFYEYALADLSVWYPKVKKDGGYVVGHDYSKPQFGVKKAVTQFLIDKPYLTVKFGPQDCWYFKKVTNSSKLIK